MDSGLEKCAKITFKKEKLMHLQNLVIDINRENTRVGARKNVQVLGN